MKIDDKTIETLLKNSIEKELKEFDLKDMVKDFIDNYMKHKLKDFADDYIREKVNESINEALSKEINTDDGWGRREHYDNFEDMFKQKFNEKLNTDWEMKRQIEQVVRERLDELFKKKTRD